MSDVIAVVSVRIQDYNASDGSFARISINITIETMPFLSVFRYAHDFSHHLDAQYFVLGMWLHGYTDTTFTCWTVILFLSLHLEHELVDSCIGANSGRRAVVVVAAVQDSRSFGCVRRSRTSIVCPICLAICSGLFVKETRLKISSFYTCVSAV